MKDVKSMTLRSDSPKERSGLLGTGGSSWRLLLIPVLLIMILPLGVNAFMFHADPQHTGIFNDGGTRPNNVLKWNYSFGGFLYDDPVNFTYIMDNSTYASPAVVNGVVYEGSLGNHFSAFNATTGAVLWTYTTDADIHASPAVTNGKVYFTTYNNELLALNAATGVQVWNSALAGAGHSSPAVVGDVVYVGDDNGTVWAFSDTIGPGDPVWAAPFQTGGVIHSSPAVANGIVYVGSDDNKTYAINAADRCGNSGTIPRMAMFTQAPRLQMAESLWEVRTALYTHSMRQPGQYSGPTPWPGPCTDQVPR